MQYITASDPSIVFSIDLTSLTSPEIILHFSELLSFDSEPSLTKTTGSCPFFNSSSII